MNKNFDIKPMLNAYPDSLGGDLKEVVNILKKEELKEVFGSFYILPSMFNTDLDRGFSVIDYNLNKEFAQIEDLEEIKKLGVNLKLDFILNHISVLSHQFSDLRKNGEKSKFKDFFIDWNKFWENQGEMTSEGYIKPNQEHLNKMFFRKPGLPLLMVTMEDGSKKPYWNTFYQEITYPQIEARDLMSIIDIQYTSADKLAKSITKQLTQGVSINDLDYKGYDISKDKDKITTFLDKNCKYLGQMDLNIKSPLVWCFYDETLKTLAGYGAKIVRLDAFAYSSKEIGQPNFLNDPQTFEILESVKGLADKYDLMLLPEIHATYQEKIHEKITQSGYPTYDFFLPGLVIDAIENKNPIHLSKWANEIIDNKMNVVNMLGCHDGIPLLDLKGILKEEEIQKLIQIIVSRGGYVKDLHGQKNMYYQVNATYYSALGEDDNKMLLARAIQLFMPGKPQIWYLDLLCGKNNMQAVIDAGANGHKEINRTNLTVAEVEDKLLDITVKKQLELIRLRNTNKAFNKQAKITTIASNKKLSIEWIFEENTAKLDVNFEDLTYKIETK